MNKNFNGDTIMPYAFSNKIIQLLILLLSILFLTIVFSGGFYFFTIIGILCSLYISYEIFTIFTIYKKQDYNIIYATCIELEKSGYRNQYNKGTFEYKNGQFSMITAKKVKLYLNAKYIFYVKKNSKQIIQTNIIAWNRTNNTPDENPEGEND